MACHRAALRSVCCCGRLRLWLLARYQVGLTRPCRRQVDFPRHCRHRVGRPCHCRRHRQGLPPTQHAALALAQGLALARRGLSSASARIQKIPTHCRGRHPSGRPHSALSERRAIRYCRGCRGHLRWQLVRRSLRPHKFRGQHRRPRRGRCFGHPRNCRPPGVRVLQRSSSPPRHSTSPAAPLQRQVQELARARSW